MDTDSIEFFSPAKSRTVHIVRNRISPLTGKEPTSAAENLMARYQSLRGVIGDIGATDAISCFEDDRLCARCARIFPEKHRDLLFEHPQSYD